MEKNWRGTALASLLIFLLLINTIIWCLPLYVFSILKLIPIASWRLWCSRINNWIANQWNHVNNFALKHMQNTRFEINDISALKSDDWYIVISNHQSWLDIVVMQWIFTGKIPAAKYFLKNELKWVPFLGLAWWGLNFPFMKRYSKEFLAKNPHFRGRDLETTRKSCAQFKNLPVSIINFAEGTRFTLEKCIKQHSPFKNLLLPKAGGLAYVLSAMADHAKKILNVTIVYPHANKGLWQFLKGAIPVIRVDVQVIDIGPELIGDYLDDLEFQQRFKAWLNKLWAEKQVIFERLNRL